MEQAPATGTWSQLTTRHSASVKTVGNVYMEYAAHRYHARTETTRACTRYRRTWYSLYELDQVLLATSKGSVQVE